MFVAYESFPTLIRPEWPQWILCINLKSGENRIQWHSGKKCSVSVFGGKRCGSVVVRGLYTSQRNALTGGLSSFIGKLQKIVLLSVMTWASLTLIAKLCWPGVCTCKKCVRYLFLIGFTIFPPKHPPPPPPPPTPPTKKDNKET